MKNLFSTDVFFHPGHYDHYDQYDHFDHFDQYDHSDHGSVECTIATGNEDPGHQILYVRYNHQPQFHLNIIIIVVI